MSSSGCDNSFQPLKKNSDYAFSIYGVLDASADTQWVRVSPPSDQLATPAEKPAMTVTLEELETGKIATMNDSLFTQDGDPRFVNTWTTMEIRNGHTYRLRAIDAEGKESRVTVTIPEPFPTPTLRREFGIGMPTTFTMFVDSMNHLADVHVEWFVRLTAPGFEEERVVSFAYRNRAEERFDGEFRVFIEPEKDQEEILQQTFLPSDGGEVEVLHRQVVIASGGPEWNPDIATSDELIYALPDGFSNVENGLGYLIGVDTKRIPLKSCRDENSLLIPCPEEEPFW
ncbi:MAG: hypothetical protein R3281_18430 [Balneolaceae bacterium]|nr:hypothetical protein [Balneolaceae bacterium]